MPVKGGYLALAGAGGLLIWSGLKGKNWSSVLKGVATGQQPSTVTTAYTIQGTSSSTSSNGNGSSNLNVTGPLGGSAKVNQGIGRVLAARYGWATGINWQALNYGWGTLESGWLTTALNGSWPSGAYGIPQAHPGNKLPKAGWPTYAGGQNSATAQILWGLEYIKQEYGSPSQVPGWLGQGGYEGY
jgi:hypothetical protein